MSARPLDMSLVGKELDIPASIQIVTTSPVCTPRSRLEA